MKTQTEIQGLDLRKAYKIRTELIQTHREQKRRASKESPKEIKEETKEETTEKARSSDVKNVAEEKQENLTQEETQEGIEEKKTEEKKTEEKTVEEKRVEEKRVEKKKTEDTPPVQEAKRIKSPEERQIEFEQKRKQEREQRQEKWAMLLEEIKESTLNQLKEKFQWNDERLKHAFYALDVIDQRRIAELRRVVVLKPDKDDEPIPRGARKIDNLVYLAEYLFRPEPPSKNKERSKGGKRNKRRKKKFFGNKDMNRASQH